MMESIHPYVQSLQIHGIKVYLNDVGGDIMHIKNQLTPTVNAIQIIQVPGTHRPPKTLTLSGFAIIQLQPFHMLHLALSAT